MLDARGIAASRKRIPAFHLERPRDLEDALRQLDTLPPARPIVHAGGLDLTNALKLAPSAAGLLDLGLIDALRQISDDPTEVLVGATATHAQVAAHPAIQTHFPGLSAFVAGLGNVRVRMQGTIGGNVMCGNPAYEMPYALAALGARLNFANAPSILVGSEASDPEGFWLAPALGLLTSIAIPKTVLAFVWFRELRPHLSLAVAFRHLEPNRILGRAALNGDARGVLTRDIDVDATVLTSPGLGDLEALAIDWRDRFARIDVAAGFSSDTCRHVLGVWLKRALERAKALVA